MYREELQALRDEADALKAELEATRLKQVSLAAEKVAAERRARVRTFEIRRGSARGLWIFAAVVVPVAFLAGGGALLLVEHLMKPSAEIVQLKESLAQKQTALGLLKKEIATLRKDVENLEKWRRYSDSGRRTSHSGYRSPVEKGDWRRQSERRRERRRRIKAWDLNRLF